MIILLLIFLLISNAVSLRQDKSILFGRLIILNLLYVNILVLNMIITCSNDFYLPLFNNLLMLRKNHFYFQFLLISVAIYKLLISNNSKSIVLLFKLCGKLFFKLLNFALISSYFSYPFLNFICLTFTLEMFDFKMNILHSTEADTLNHDMLITLKQIAKMKNTLGDIKREHGIKLYLTNDGGISMDAPNKLSEEEINVIRNKVSIADRVYQTQLEKYETMVNRDEKYNDGRFTAGFKKNFELIKSDYNKLFDKDE